MDAYLNANADGISLLFWAGVAAIIAIGFAAVVEQLVLRRDRRRTLTHIDLRRCERAGSQDEFERRIQAARGWR